MGLIKEHPPVKYFAGITYSPDFVNLKDCLDLLEKNFSKIENNSELYEFSNFTEYYESEMGINLKKYFIIFSKLQPPEKLPNYKIISNQIESQFIKDEKRQINIDPGYLSEAKVVLATTKNYDHRIYLGQGIFADLHLRFTNKEFNPQPWTYPDYKQEKILKFFMNLRQNYFKQLSETFSNI